MTVSYTIGTAGGAWLKIGPSFYYAGIGILAGVLQWLILKKQFRQAEWWVVANIVGWAVGHGNIITILITGVVLVWILRRPIQQPDQSTSSVPSM